MTIWKGPARMQKGREKNSLGELRSRRRKGFGSRRGEREAKDGAKDKKRRSNYSFWGFYERGDSTSRIYFISLISPRKKLPLFLSLSIFPLQLIHRPKDTIYQGPKGTFNFPLSIFPFDLSQPFAVRR